MEYTDIKLTEEQRLKLQALYEAENLKPEEGKNLGKNVEGVNKIWKNIIFLIWNKY